MNQTHLDQLAQATTEEERNRIVLEMSLARLHPELLEAVQAAAIPHWFDFNYLSALIGEDASDLIYDELLDQSFVEHIPGRGYAIHERTRYPLLDKIWEEDQAQFRLISGYAADHCAKQDDGSYWQSEEIYHRLISDIDIGLDRFQQMATSWANFEQSSYEDIEQVTRMAEQHIDAGRLFGQTANWVYLWQARLHLLYTNTGKARSAMSKISADDDPLFSAEHADTLGDLEIALENAEEAKTAWESAARSFDKSGKSFESYLVQEKLQAHGLITQEKAGIDPSKKTTDPLTLKLLDNIEEAWIDGVLREVLTPEQEGLDLPLSKERTISGQLKVTRSGTVDHTLNQGGNLSRLFNASGRSLLILGAPGSGKTITMLELLDELISLARENSDEPTPLLFNLSSFGAYLSSAKGDFASWLAEEASTQYSMSRYITKNQLELGGKYTLLLDGLDEVPNKNGERDQVVDAINEFMQTHPGGLAVCSRITDYRALESKLAIQHSVVIQPLTNGQITGTLDQIGRSALNDLVDRQWRLREALRSPLLLSLFPKAVSASAAESLVNVHFETLEEWRQEIFGRYVEAVLPVDESEQSRSWLQNLANGMQAAGTTVFNIEDLQSFWLQSENGQENYRAYSGAFLASAISLVYAPIMALIIIFSSGFRSSNGSKSPFAILFTLGVSITIVTIAFIVGRLTASIDRPYRRGLVSGVAAWLSVGITALILWPTLQRLTGSSFDLPVEEYVFALIFALGTVISIGLNSWSPRIRLVEKVAFSLPTIEGLKHYLQEFLQLILLFFVLFLFTGPIFEDGGLTLRFLLVWILPSALLTGVLCWVGLASINPVVVSERKNPGEGISASLKSALQVTLFITPIFLLTSSILDGFYQANFKFIFVILATVLPAAFSWSGAMTWTQHWTLRWLLSKEGTLPFDLPEWLQKMARSGLLRRAGGGYIFIHRSVLEYFADSD